MAQKWPKIGQKLAPAKLNSRDISPVSPTFSISAWSDRWFSSISEEKKHSPVTEEKNWGVQAVSKLLHPHLGFQMFQQYYDHDQKELFPIRCKCSPSSPWLISSPSSLKEEVTSLYPRRDPSARQSLPSSPPSRSLATLMVIMIIKMIKMITQDVQWHLRSQVGGGGPEYMGERGSRGELAPLNIIISTINEHQWPSPSLSHCGHKSK